MERLKAAAVDGLVLAVKWAIVILGVSLTVGAILSDYSQTRANAAAAVQWIQQQQAQPPKK